MLLIMLKCIDLKSAFINSSFLSQTRMLFKKIKCQIQDLPSKFDIEIVLALTSVESILHA